jgi:hypothetical protein
MLHTRPTSIEECDEHLARIRQARRECAPTELVLIRSYDDMTDELLAIRFSLLPEQREP